MADVHESESAHKSLGRSSVLVWMVIGWLWVGIPLAWGVWMTARTSFALFGRQKPSAAKPAAR